MSATPPEWTRAQIDALRRRDAATWDRFFVEFGPRLQWVIARLCPWRERERGQQAEWTAERFNDFVVHLLDKDPLDGYDPSRSKLMTYLCMLAVRMVISHLRKERRPLRLTDLYAAPPDGVQQPTQEELIEADLVIKLLERFRDRVDDEMYQSFALLFLMPGTTGEQAAALGTPAGALHKRRQRLRERLRALAAELEAEGEAAPAETPGRGGKKL